MGCWNGTCAISNLHVRSGQRVAVFVLLENVEKKTFCYSNALYDLCPIPFYGKYNDYGAVEECEGFGLPIVLEAIRSKLYKFGQGPNSCHDIEVNKDTFDIEMLFDADHEDRLGIEQFNRWNSDKFNLNQLQQAATEQDGGLTESQQFELDRLANKIKAEDNFRRVTHVIVHGDVFDHILNEWKIEEYVGDSKGTHGYNKNYKYTTFQDVLDSIPEYIRRLKENNEQEDEAGVAASKFMRRMGMRDIFEWNDPCLAGCWMRFDSSESNMFGLIRVSDHVNEYLDKKDYEGLAAFAKEALTTKWICAFMSYTRKTWSKQSGMGSQSDEHSGYRALAEAITKVLDAENAEREDWDSEDDDETMTPEQVAEIEEDADTRI